jgi:pimeloyl-ACP methyl ester carboxylesterase
MRPPLRPIEPVALLTLLLGAGCGDAPLGGDPSDGGAAATSGPVDGAGGASTASGSASGGGEGAGGQPDEVIVIDCQGLRPTPFALGGQAGWCHDDGFVASYVHTYDALDVDPGVTAPHKVHVLLPRGYGSGERYPVVYMNDGSTAFWPGGPGNKSWDVPARLAELYEEGSLDEVLVVAVEPNNRNIEYSHTTWSDDPDCCGADAYALYLADGVRAFIDAWYATRAGPETTAIVGSSRGGLASFYVANRRPDVFGRAGCLSPSFWAGLDPVYGGDMPGGPLSSSLLISLVEGTLATPSVRPRLWIDWGLVRTGGFHNEVIEAAATQRGIEMVDLLEEAYGYADGVELSWYEDPIGEHDEVSWSRRFPMVMKALFAP